ncbi:hypothetical protein [Lysobacter sp. HA18]
MNLKQEKLLLSRADVRLTQAVEERPLWLYELLSWVVLAVAAAAGITIVGGPVLRAVLVVAVGFFAGLAVTVLLLKRVGMLQWRAIAPFVDRAGLSARIEQLGA